MNSQIIDELAMFLLAISAFGGLLLVLSPFCWLADRIITHIQDGSRD